MKPKPAKMEKMTIKGEAGTRAATTHAPTAADCTSKGSFGFSVTRVIVGTMGGASI